MNIAKSYFTFIASRRTRLYEVGRFKFGILALLLLSFNAVAAPVLEGIETTNNDGAMSINLGIPVNTVGAGAGDLLVATVGVRGNPATSFPVDWTEVTGHAGFNDAICSSDDEGIACQLSVYWKISDGSEASVSVFLNAGNVSQAAGAVFRYSSTHTVTPIGQVSTQSGNSGMPTAPDLVTNEDDVRVIQLVVSDTNGGSFPQLPLTSEPPDAVFNLNSRTPLTRDSIVMGGAEFAEAVSGSNIGAGVWTGGENNWRGSTLTIRPEQTVVNVDLAITKSASPTKVNAGEDITYTVVASNSGVSANDVTGATVSDIFATDLSCSWTCTALAGASCSAAGSGDISDSVDLDIGSQVTYTAVCTVDSNATGNIGNTASIGAPSGVTDVDTANNSDMVSTLINQPPNAECQNVTVDADDICQADASIDNGSADPDGDNPITIDEDPAGPYGLGDTSVQLTITDGLGLSDSCIATVTVQDVTPPTLACNTPATIVPPDAPIAFTATAEDNCSAEAPAITSFRCFKFTRKGKLIDKGESCEVSIAGDTLLIDDAGGVGTTIEWQVSVSDGSGNMTDTTCSVDVANPGNN